MAKVPNICVIGSCMVDLISRVPRLPAPGETLVGSDFRIGYGGKGANQAVMAARLGAHVSVVARVGRDIFGENTLRNMADQGIDTTYVSFDEMHATGVAPIAVDTRNGQNAIIIVPGANETLTPKLVREAAPAIEQADVVVAQCEVPLDATLEAFRIAAANRNTVTILNPAPAPAELPVDLLALTDILVPNEHEAAQLTGLPYTELENTVAASAVHLVKQGARVVIVTMGDRGALLQDGEEPAIYVPAGRVEAVDTTGAGDAFVGSLATFIGEGKPLAQAVRWACVIASHTVQKPGTQSSMPLRSEILHLLL